MSDKIFADDYTDSSTSETSSSSSSDTSSPENKQLKISNFIYKDHKTKIKYLQSADNNWKHWAPDNHLSSYKLIRQYNDEFINKKIFQCKLKHRSSLKNPKDWQRYSFYKIFDNYKNKIIKLCESIEKKHIKHVKLRNDCPNNPNLWYYKINSQCIDRINEDDLSISKFEKYYIHIYKPCIIKNVCNNWPGRNSWNIKSLANNIDYKNVKLRCGEDDDGNAVKIRLKYFLEYMELQQDDSPLYLFDSNFKKNHASEFILNGYQVPKFLKKIFLIQ